MTVQTEKAYGIGEVWMKLQDPKRTEKIYKSSGGEGPTKEVELMK